MFNIVIIFVISISPLNMHIEWRHLLEDFEHLESLSRTSLSKQLKGCSRYLSVVRIPVRIQIKCSLLSLMNLILRSSCQCMYRLIENISLPKVKVLKVKRNGYFHFRQRIAQNTIIGYVSLFNRMKRRLIKH